MYRLIVGKNAELFTEALKVALIVICLYMLKLKRIMVCSYKTIIMKLE